jgi:NTE family protein
MTDTLADPPQHASSQDPGPVRYGLVLGGGGAVGVAWEIAVLSALDKAGVPLSGAEIVVGTSAGSIVGAQLLGGRSFADMLAEQAVDTSPPEIESESGSGASNETLGVFTAIAGLTDPAERGRRLGAIGLSAPVMPEQAYLGMMTSLIQVTQWPATRFIPTAVDCQTGERVGWQAALDIPLVAAVASSCCVPGLVPPVTIRGRRYIDGGAWSPSNADLLLDSGVSKAVFIGPFGGPGSDGIMNAAEPLERELAALEDDGIATVSLTPSPALFRQVGGDFLNPALRTVGIERGLADGRADAERIRRHLAG